MLHPPAADPPMNSWSCTLVRKILYRYIARILRSQTGLQFLETCPIRGSGLRTFSLHGYVYLVWLE